MDIGTAKANPQQRRRVPHHLIDVIGPESQYSLAEYVAAAHQAVAEIRRRGREALLVGGTPLYLKAMLRGMFEGPEADWPLRDRLQQEAAEQGTEALHTRLAKVDPRAAARLHPGDLRRIIRALEVREKTGEPISQQQQQFETSTPADACRVFLVDRPRDELYVRIEARVDAMFAAGLVDEVRGLLASGRSLSRTAGQAVGYREVIAMLAGERDLAETVALVKTRTRQFARRQLTWFRSLSECRNVPVARDDDPAEIARWIADRGPRIAD